jgi:catechol 2,3-dioxygenase-like lactoylglutathione lyase family enzyme
MINHVSIGVRDLTRAKRFYDAALEPLGYNRLVDGDDGLGYGQKNTSLWILKTDSPVPTDERPGLHFCFDAATRKGVRAFHKAALAAGGRDNGKPGLRTAYGPDYYAAFVIDPDGYRIEAHCGTKT